MKTGLNADKAMQGYSADLARRGNVHETLSRFYLRSSGFHLRSSAFHV
jgi:hypothetical protein